MLQIDGLPNEMATCPAHGSHAQHDRNICGMGRKDNYMNFSKSITHMGLRQLFRKASDSQATPVRSATLSNGELKQIVAAMLG